MKSRGQIVCAAICILLHFRLVNAQSLNSSDSEAYIMEISSWLTENMEYNADLSSFTSNLQDYLENPLDLNTATYEELAGFLILSETEIQSFLEYRLRYFPLLTIYELKLVKGWSVEKCKLLQPFITVRPPGNTDRTNFRQALRMLKHEWISRAGFGYPIPDAYSGAVYQGKPLSIYTRYRLRYKDRISFGITADHDAGEPFGRLINRAGFDFYSAHLFIQKPVRFVEYIAVGDYQIQAGQGLTCRAGFAMGKSLTGATLCRRGPEVKPYTSANEMQYFRGFALTIKPVDVLRFTMWYSNKKLDASVQQGDTTTPADDFMYSISGSGLHRTASEMARKYTLREQIGGFMLQSDYKSLRVGFLTMFSNYSIPFVAGKELYRRNDFSGRNLWNLSFFCQYVYKSVHTWCEIAYSLPGKASGIAGVQITPGSRISLQALFRWMSPEYNAFYTNAIQNNNRARNEESILFMLNLLPLKYVRFAAFADLYRYPAPVYRCSVPQRGADIGAEAAWKPARTLEWILRYRYRTELSDLTTQNVLQTGNVHRHQARLVCDWQPHQNFECKTRVEYSGYKGVNGEYSSGSLLLQTLGWKFRDLIGISLSAVLFSTRDYYSRITVQEADVLSMFSTFTGSGRGYRFLLNLRISALKALTIWLRAAHTTYDDRNTIGSGSQEIQGNMKTDFRVQFRLRL